LLAGCTAREQTKEPASKKEVKRRIRELSVFKLLILDTEIGNVHQDKSKFVRKWKILSRNLKKIDILSECTVALHPKIYAASALASPALASPAPSLRTVIIRALNLLETMDIVMDWLVAIKRL
jgi:hypothetical protein